MIFFIIVSEVKNYGNFCELGRLNIETGHFYPATGAFNHFGEWHRGNNVFIKQITSYGKVGEGKHDDDKKTEAVESQSSIIEASNGCCDNNSDCDIDCLVKNSFESIHRTGSGIEHYKSENQQCSHKGDKGET